MLSRRKMSRSYTLPVSPRPRTHQRSHRTFAMQMENQDMISTFIIVNQMSSSPRYNVPDGLEKDFRVTATATYTPESSGVHEFGLEVVGKAKLFINDELVVDNWTKQTWGSSFANDGSIEEVGQIKLERGVFYDFRIIFETGPDFGGDYVPQNVPMVEEGGGLRFGGGYKIDPDGGITEAVKIASEADHIVIFAGLNVSTIFCKC